MNWEGTGGDVQLKRAVNANVRLESESVSGQRWAPGIETLGSRSTGEASRRSAVVPPTKAAVSPRRLPDRALRRRRLCLKACLEDLERVQNAGDDPILKGNAIADVRNHLQQLWEVVEGNPDSEAFEEMVNLLQVAFCIENPDSLTPRQLEGLRSVLMEMHHDPEMGDEAANDLTQELIRSGVDVFREIG